MEPMSCDDLVFITCSLYPQLSEVTVKRMIEFNEKVLCHLMSCDVIVVKVRSLCCHDNSLWEFNLRDILRWCQLMKANSYWSPSHWAQQFYICRLRSYDLREQVS